MRTIRGAGLTLEPQVAAHATELFAVIGDPALYTYIDEQAPVSEAALRERLGRLESRLSPNGNERWLNWVVRTDGGRVAGYVQATVEIGGLAEIAYVLGSAHQRQGIGFAAVSAMLDELRIGYEVTRAVATLDPDNTGSLALLRKLGFRLEREDAAAHEVRYARDLRGGL